MKWTQFHLSTLLILMFASGLLIWANVTRTNRCPAQTEKIFPLDRVMIKNPDGSLYHLCEMQFDHGWPMTFNSSAVAIEPRLVYLWRVDVAVEDLKNFPKSENERKIFNSGNSFEGEWLYFPLAVNVATGLAILIVFGSVIELAHSKNQKSHQDRPA